MPPTGRRPVALSNLVPRDSRVGGLLRGPSRPHADSRIGGRTRLGRCPRRRPGDSPPARQGMAGRLAHATGRRPTRASERSLRCGPVCRLAAVGMRGKGLVTGPGRARLATRRRARPATRTRRARATISASRTRLASGARRARLASRAGRARKASALAAKREGRFAVGPRWPWLADAHRRRDRFAAGLGRVRPGRHWLTTADAGQPEPSAPSPAVGAGGRSRSVPRRLPAPLTCQRLGCILAAA